MAYQDKWVQASGLPAGGCFLPFTRSITSIALTSS